jgi:hypothetical protein
MANQDRDQTKNMGGQSQGMGADQGAGGNKLSQDDTGNSTDTIERNPKERGQSDRGERDENKERGEQQPHRR